MKRAPLNDCGSPSLLFPTQGFILSCHPPFWASTSRLPFHTRVFFYGVLVLVVDRPCLPASSRPGIGKSTAREAFTGKYGVLAAVACPGTRVTSRLTGLLDVGSRGTQTRSVWCDVTVLLA